MKPMHELTGLRVERSRTTILRGVDWRELRLQIGVVTSAFATAIPPAEVALDTVVSGSYAQLDLWHRVTRADRAAGLRRLRSIGAAGIAGREWAYLSSENLSATFAARLRLNRTGPRHRLEFPRP